MTDRKRSILQYTMANLPILSMYLSPTVSGITIGLRSLKRNVKLTYCINLNGEFDCHVKDDGDIVWQKTCPQSEMMKRLEGMFKKSMFRWKPRQKIIRLDPRLLDHFNGIHASPGKTIDIDLEGFLVDSIDMIKVILRGNVRLGDIMKDDPVIGFQKRWSGMWVIIAAPDGLGFGFPLRTDKGLLGELFIFQGLEFYFDYLEEQGLLDDLGLDSDSPKGIEIMQNLNISLLNAGIMDTVDG